MPSKACNSECKRLGHVSVITELEQQWPGLQIVHGKPRNPRSQGAVERANADIQNILRAWMEHNVPTGLMA